MPENPFQTEGMEVDDFSGGMTDNYIGSGGRTNQFQTADNMVLKKYGDKGKLITRGGSRIYDLTNYQIPSTSRISHLAECEETLFQFSGRNAYTITPGGWHTITGPTGNPVLSTGAVGNYVSTAEWNKHLIVVNDALAQPQKIYHNGTTWVARTLGLPEIDPDVITLTTGAAGGNSYIYAFIRSDTYTIGTVTFREVSASSVKNVSSASEPSASPMAIAGIPVLANGTSDNYNTTSSKIEIYRTTNNGTTFFKVGEVTNGTTTFSDTMSDATLQTKAALYTEGGVVDFEQVPKSNYVVVTGDTAFYLGVQDGTEFHGNRVRQSIPGALYASPSDFYVDLGDDITGGGVFNTSPIVFTKNRTYRIEGRFDEFGQGGMFAREISNTVGCISHRSVVATKDGIFFAADDGFYYTDGFIVKKISSEFNTSYKQLVEKPQWKTQITGAYDPFTNRIWWAGQRDVASFDNDLIFVAHLDAPNTPFTTISGGTSVDNFTATALLYFGRNMLRADRRGYLFKHLEDFSNDPKIDVNKVPSAWGEVPIIYDYRSPAFDFGTTKVRKWVPRIVVNADNVTNLSLQISSNDDNAGLFSPLASVTYSSNFVWGDEDVQWGNPDLRWNYSAVISHWRRFPAGTLRCIYKQVRMTNAYADIDSSVTVGTASTDGQTKTVTLELPDRTWTTKAIDYYISFGEDGFLREYHIIDRLSATVIKVVDPDGSLTTASGREWKIKGYKKNEVFNLLSYVIDFAPLTMTQDSGRTQQ